MKGVSATAISKWRDQFIEAGTAGVAVGGRAGPSTREWQLEAELSEMTLALGKTTAELRAWKKGAAAGGRPTRARPDPHHGRRPDLEEALVRAARHPPLELPPQAQAGPRGPRRQGPVASAGRGSDRPGRRRHRHPLGRLGTRQGHRDDARRWPHGRAIAGAAGAAAPGPGATGRLPAATS